MGASKELFMEERQREVASSLQLESLMDSDKSQIEERVRFAVSQVAEGNTDPIKALIYASKGKVLFDLLEKNVRPHAEGKGILKGYTAYNVAIIEKSGGDKFDFESTGDSEWLELQQTLEETKQKIKDREAFLKALKEPVHSTKTGELINPPQKTFGKQTLALTIK